MLGVFPKDAKGLKASILLMVVGRVGYVGLDLLKRRVKAVEARARADQPAAAPAPAAQKKEGRVTRRSSARLSFSANLIPSPPPASAPGPEGGLYVYHRIWDRLEADVTVLVCLPH